MERSIAIRREWAIEFVGRRRLSGTNVTTSFRNARIEQNSLFRLLIRPQATFCPHLGVVFSIARHLVKVNLRQNRWKLRPETFATS